MARMVAARVSTSNSTAGIDVKLPLQTATANVAGGRIADLQGSPREQPESAGDRALGLMGYRLISARTRRSNDVSTGRPRRKAVDSLGFVDRPRPIHESAHERFGGSFSQHEVANAAAAGGRFGRELCSGNLTQSTLWAPLSSTVVSTLSDVPSKWPVGWVSRNRRVAAALHPSANARHDARRSLSG
jgi:hypothetical protein